MAIKEFIISPGNYFEDGFFDGDYTERQNQSFATLTCEVERLAGFEFAAGFYFEEGFIEEGAFGVNSIIFTLEVEAMVVQEATVNARDYFDGTYYESGYYADSGSRFTLTIDLGQTVEAQGAFISEFAQVSTVGKLQDVVLEFESLFTPGFTVEAIKNSTAILDSVANLTATTSKFTGYESLLEFIAALNAQAARTRDADGSAAAEFSSDIETARTRDTASLLAVSTSVNIAVDVIKQTDAVLAAVVTQTATATRIQTATASLSSSATVVANVKAGVLKLRAATLRHTIPNPDLFGTMTDDEWGRSVAQNNTFAVVGMPQEEGVGLPTNSGRVSVINLSTGAIQYTIQHPVPVTSGSFGRVVAVSNSYFAAASSTNVYVFNLSNGSLQNTYTYENTAGIKVLSLTDSYLAIGSPNSDIGGATNNGQVGIFNVSTGASVRTLNNPNAFGTQDQDFFGNSIKVHGNLVLVAAQGEDDAFSSSDFNNAAGKVYLFNIDTGALLHTFNNPAVNNETEADGFAVTVDMNSNYITIGANQEEPFGVVYVYSASTYEQLYRIDSPSLGLGRFFSVPLKLSGDYLITKTNIPRAAYIYDLRTGTDFVTINDPDYFGDGTISAFGVALDISADYAVITDYFESVSEGGAEAPNAGVVYIYDLVKGINITADAVLTSSFNLSADTTVIKGTSVSLTSVASLTVESVKVVEAAATLLSEFNQTVLNSRTRDVDTDFESIATQISAVGRVGQGFITLDSVASVLATAEKVAVASSTLESTAEFNSSADRTRSDAASLNSEFAFTASIDKFVGFASAQSSTASLETVADKFAGFASAQSSEFALTADVDKFAGNQIVIGSEFAQDAQAQRIRFADSAQFSEFTVFADTVKSITGVGAFETTAELTATALRIQQGIIQTDSVATQLVAVAKIGDFLITMDSVASVSADASVTSGSIATANSEFDLATSGDRIRFGNSTQNAVTALSVSGTLASDSTVAIASEAQLSVSSTRTAALSADLQTTGNLDAISLRILDFSADLEAFNSVLSVIDKFAENQTDMLVESTLVASADRSRDNIINTTANADLTSSGERVRFNTADLDSTATVEAAISRTKQFEINLTGAMQFESTVVAQRTGEILSQVTASLEVSAQVIRGVSVALSSVSTQNTVATKQHAASASLNSTATLAATVRLFVLLEEYVFVIPREHRTFSVSKENRSHAIRKEDREFIIRG